MAGPATAQTFNGKNLRWEAKTDKRIKAFLGTVGSSFGSESVSLAVENLTETKLAVKFKVTLTDFCGTASVHNISHTVGALSKAGFSPWFDGFSYSTKCKEVKKYAENFGTRISNANIELVSIQEIQGSAGSSAKKLECKDLVAYRDTKLVALWDKQHSKYKLKTNMIADISKMKDTLLIQSQRATSNWNLAVLTLKTAANAIEDVISAASPQGHLMKVAKSTGSVAVSRVKVYELIKKGDKALEASASEDVAKTIAIQAATELGRMGSILSVIKNLHDNIQSLNDYQNVKQEVNKQMASLNKAMVNYNAQLTKSQKDMKELNQYKEFIDQYLKENCSN